MKKKEIAIHAIIHGRVQGVGYRHWTAQEALKKDISGWVRNKTDGTVEAVIQGLPENVNDMIDICYKGPMLAKVTKVSTTNTSPENFTGFNQKSTI